MASLLRHVPAVLVFVFALLSLIFSIVAIVSKEWAVRSNYNTRLNIEDWSAPLYTIYRSPFLICSASLVNATNTTSQYSSNCERWKPSGLAKTSCESANATGNDTASNVGDTRLCQQIHFAGNFAIASTAFIGLATLLTLAITVLMILRKDVSSEESLTTSSNVQGPKRNIYEQTQQVATSSLSASNQVMTRSVMIWSYVSYVGLVCFGVGIITAVIAQFYAILGLTMSLPNNSDFASSAVGSLDDVNTQGSHGPWHQGRALSTYWTCAWGFGLAAIALASRAWTLPRWR